MTYQKIIGEKEKAVESVELDFLGVYRQVTRKELTKFLHAARVGIANPILDITRVASRDEISVGNTPPAHSTRHCGKRNEPDRSAALRFARQGSLLAARPAARIGSAHGRDRPAGLLQRTAIREISAFCERDLLGVWCDGRSRFTLALSE